MAMPPTLTAAPIRSQWSGRDQFDEPEPAEGCGDLDAPVGGGVSAAGTTRVRIKVADPVPALAALAKAKGWDKQDGNGDRRRMASCCARSRQSRSGRCT